MLCQHVLAASAAPVAVLHKLHKEPADMLSRGVQSGSAFMGFSKPYRMPSAQVMHG